jgi:RNA polymerase sigma-70 factor (ECF subfamily)
MDPDSRAAGPAAQAPYEEAFRRVLAHRTMLKAYVQAIVRDPLLAEDTFSDLTLEIARCWGTFDQNRPFENWARGVARRVALTNLRKQTKQPTSLSEEVLEAVGLELETFGSEVQLETRKEALQRCVQKLSTANRELVRWRYFENRSYEEVAERSGRSMGALYVVFTRIHQALGRCIERVLRSV